MCAEWRRVVRHHSRQRLLPDGGLTRILHPRPCGHIRIWFAIGYAAEQAALLVGLAKRIGDAASIRLTTLLTVSRGLGLNTPKTFTGGYRAVVVGTEVLGVCGSAGIGLVRANARVRTGIQKQHTDAALAMAA
jgi:hypothetical protein